MSRFTLGSRPRHNMTEEFNKLVKHRKQMLNYTSPKNNKTGNKCDQCLYLESFSPYMHRCTLISYGEERVCSVNIFAVCDQFNDKGREKAIYEKFESIEFDKMFPMML